MSVGGIPFLLAHLSHRILELRMREAWFAYKLRMREQRLMMHALSERRNKKGNDMWTCI